MLLGCVNVGTLGECLSQRVSENNREKESERVMEENARRDENAKANEFVCVWFHIKYVGEG